MGSIRAFFHGQEIANLQLEAGQEYIIGRGTESHIQLPNEKGISRQHLRLHDQTGVWTVELISKTGDLILDGESTSGIELSASCRFSVPPFEFSFEANEEVVEEISEDASTDNIVQEDTSSQLQDLSEQGVDITSTDSMDSTMAGVSNLVPMLKVSNEKTGEEYSLKLDGNIWVAGRNPDSEIHISDSAISRKHFEITQIGNSFSIKDVGSSNGTLLNGNAITPHEDTELSSGDTIKVRHISILFEIIDKNYEQKMAAVKELAIVDPMTTQQEPHANYGGPAVIRVEADLDENTNFLANPKFKKALMIGAPLLLIIAIFVGGGEDRSELNSKAPDKPVTTAEDLAEAKHLLEVAKGHYISRNYSFCVTQLQKLHDILPSYEDSKELEAYCQQAIELEKEQADKEAIEKNRREVQAKIQNVIDNCEQSITASMTSAELQICLQPALELSPEEPRALALIKDMEDKEQNAWAVEQMAKARAARVKAGKSAYSKAVSLEKRGKLKSAKAQYFKFLQGGYGLRTEEKNARRSIASIDKKLEAKVASSVKSCESLLKENNYKKAINQCEAALKIDSENEQAIAAYERTRRKLRVEMKKIWDSSVLEESFGNIEAAKSRWKEIVEKSVPTDNYYKKAKNKLKAYGIE